MIDIRLKVEISSRFLWKLRGYFFLLENVSFIKRMFPDVMRDIEQDSIRNFKFQPNIGNIVIDEPDKGDYQFHFE